jgi:hypothetical protein
VGLVPLTERSGIDLDNSRLGQGVGTDELVVGRVVGDTDDTGLAGDTLGAPGEVAGVETEGTELAVTTTGAHEMDTLGTDTGVGSLTALLESCRDEKSERQFVKQSGYGVGHQFCLRTALLVGGNAKKDVSECASQRIFKVADTYRLAPEAERFQLPLREIPMLSDYEGCYAQASVSVLSLCVQAGG